MAGCPSGQWKRTVNPSAYAYAGSNPAPATETKGPGAQRRDPSCGRLLVCRAQLSENRPANSRLKAGMSSGLRLVTRLPSTTTSSSTQVPPALRTSVWRLGQEVSVRPRTTSASTSDQIAWQMAATGLPDATKERTKSTASEYIRSWSPFATPPGSTRPSYDVGSASETTVSTAKVSALSRWL